LFSSSPKTPASGQHSPEEGREEEGETIEQQQQVTSDAELMQLRDLLKQRDDEISIPQTMCGYLSFLSHALLGIQYLYMSFSFVSYTVGREI